MTDDAAQAAPPTPAAANGMHAAPTTATPATATPARAFLLPGLQALLAEAATRGISRDVAVAVLIDLVTGPGFNDTPLDPLQDAPNANAGTAPFTTGEEAIAAAAAIPADHIGQHRAGRASIGHALDPGL